MLSYDCDFVTVQNKLWLVELAARHLAIETQHRVGGEELKKLDKQRQLEIEVRSVVNLIGVSLVESQNWSRSLGRWRRDRRV